MIWKKCELMAYATSEEDALGNEVGKDLTTVKEVQARYTPWSDIQIQLEGRDVTKTDQFYILKIPYNIFPQCTHARIGNVVHEIKDKYDLFPRYTAIRTEAYKNEDQA